MLENQITLVLSGRSNTCCRYVGSSSVEGMSRSVQHLRHLLLENQVPLVLPGHNGVLDRDAALAQADKHIESARDILGTGIGKRHLAKAFSRTRTASILALNQAVPMPDLAREWLQS